MLIILRKLVLIGAMCLVAIGMIPSVTVEGHQAVIAIPDIEVGIDFRGEGIKIKYAIVTQDVCSTHTEGMGTFFIENVANTTNSLDVTFFGRFRPVNVSAVKINHTFIPFENTPACQDSCYKWWYDVIFQIGFTPCASQILQIWWNFDGCSSTNNYYNFPEHTQSVSSTTGFLIYNWDHILIEWEEIRFNFHDEGFSTSRQDIGVWIKAENCWRHALQTQSKRDPNDVPYFLYSANNIDDSVNIYIEDYLWIRIRGDLVIIVLIMATLSAVGVPWVAGKKKRKYAGKFSGLGLVFFLTFLAMPVTNFVLWGEIVLWIYLTAIFIIILKHYKENLGAIKVYKENRSLNANEFITWSHLAQAYFRTGKEQRAKEACLRALEFPPTDPDSVKILRSLYQLLRLDSRSLTPESLLLTGEQLYARGRVKFAREVFFAAFEATMPDSPLETKALRCLNKCAERNGHLMKSGVRIWGFRLFTCLLVLSGVFFGFNFIVELVKEHFFNLVYPLLILVPLTFGSLAMYPWSVRPPI